MRPSVLESLDILNNAVADGSLERLCDRYGLDLVVLFGSAVDSDDPGDIDLALAFGKDSGKDFLATLTDLQALVPGDHLDVMNLDVAEPVARYEAMTHGQPLFARTGADFWERQIFAINHYIETQPLRDALLRSLAS